MVDTTISRLDRDQQFAMDTTTLRRVLSQQKPHIHCGPLSSKNSAYGKWPKLVNAVTIWDDFHLANLNESYGHILDCPVPVHQLQVPRPDQALKGVTIENPDSVKHLIVWNDGMMRPTLEFAKRHLGLCPGIALRHRVFDADKNTIARIPHEPRLAVDHVADLDDFPLPTLVVGLARPSVKWSGMKLAYQLHNTSGSALWPLRQLANLCRATQTRYGYIQTDKEMVVCCFRKDGSEHDERWKATIMPVPWSRHGPDTLTTDLALWWLCMLAMSAPHNRALVGEGDVVRINAWEVLHADEERGWVRRHRYSKVEEPDPSPPPIYNTPSPTNVAALEAAVGLHANEWFNLEAPANVPLPDLFGQDIGLAVPYGAGSYVDTGEDHLEH